MELMESLTKWPKQSNKITMTRENIYNMVQSLLVQVIFAEKGHRLCRLNGSSLEIFHILYML